MEQVLLQNPIQSLIDGGFVCFILFIICIIVFILILVFIFGRKKTIIQTQQSVSSPIIIPETSKQREKERFCPDCGRTIPFDANLCPYCGKKFKEI